MSKIYNPSGGYRKLHSFNFASIIHLGTISFCKRYLSWKDDPLGKTLGQMIGASRSGKQNIIEGSERAKTSSETEIYPDPARHRFARAAIDPIGKRLCGGRGYPGEDDERPPGSTRRTRRAALPRMRRRDAEANLQARAILGLRRLPQVQGREKD